MRGHLSTCLHHPLAKWVIVALHVALLGLLYSQQGIADDKEALKYLGCATDVVNGVSTDLFGRYRLFATYVIFLVPFVALGLPHLAVLAQVAIGLAAGFALKRCVQGQGVSPALSNMAMAAYLLAYPIQTWTLTLYSEALFVPLCVLFLERAFRLRPTERWTMCLAILVVLTRPTGVLFVLPMYLWYMSERFLMGRAVALVGIVSGLLVALLWVPIMNREQLAIVVEAHVVCGFPEHPLAAANFAGRTLMSAQEEVMDQHGVPYWAGLVLRRMVSLFNPTRPYFSTAHNVLVVPLLMLYPLALLGLWHARKNRVVSILVVIVVLNTLLVGLTYDEWNARFLAPVLPLVILLAAHYRTWDERSA